MNSKEFKNYNKRCSIIERLILDKFIYENITFKRDNKTLYVEIIINLNSKVTIYPNSTLYEIFINVSEIIANRTTDCINCNKRINKNVSCLYCFNDYCINCYIKLFERGKGIIICPKCLKLSGFIISDHILKTSIEEIIKQLDYYNKN